MLELILTPTIVVIALIVTGWFSKRYIEETVFDVINDLKGEVIEIAPQLMEQLGSNILDKFKMSIMGMKSGKVRGEKAATKSLISEVIQSQNPLVGLLVDRIPELKDAFADNPEALMQLLPLAQKFLGGGGSSPNTASSLIPSSPTSSSSKNNPFWRCV